MWNSSRALLAVRGFIYLFLILKLMSKLAFIHHSDAEQPEEEANPISLPPLFFLMALYTRKVSMFQVSHLPHHHSVDATNKIGCPLVV